MSSVLNSRSKFGINPQIAVLQHQMRSKEVNFEDLQAKLNDLEDVVASHVLALKAQDKTMDNLVAELRDVKGNRKDNDVLVSEQLKVVDAKVEGVSAKIPEQAEALRSEFMQLVMNAEHKISYVRTEALSRVDALKNEVGTLDKETIKQVQDNKDVIDIMMSTQSSLRQDVSALQKQQAFLTELSRNIEANLLALKESVQQLKDAARPPLADDGVE